MRLGIVCVTVLTLFFLGLFAYFTTKQEVAQPSPTQNTFVNDIENKDSEIVRKQKEMAAFSKILQKEMGLTDKQVEKAEKHDISWQLSGYRLKAENFAHFEGNGGWIILLYAHPNLRVYGPNWYVYYKGTGTIVVPNEQEQARIIKAIKEYNAE